MTITNTMIAIPLDVGLLSKNFEDTNQFEIFIINSNNKVLKQSTVTLPIAEKSSTLGDWLASLGVNKVFVSKDDEDAHKIFEKQDIEIINISKQANPEHIIWEYVKSKQEEKVA